MSFLGNNRPDLLKTNAETEATARGTESRFLGEVPSPAPEPVPSFGSDRYTSSTATATPSSTDGALAPDRCTNVVAAGAKWKGTLKVEDSVRVDGVFSGELDAKGTVHVSEGAEVDAKIHAAFVVISGTFRGEIRAERKAELMPTSRVTGEVMAKALSIHEGATLDGTVQMTDNARPNNQQSSRSNNRNGSTPETEPAQQERRNRNETATASTNGSGGA